MTQFLKQEFLLRNFHKIMEYQTWELAFVQIITK